MANSELFVGDEVKERDLEQLHLRQLTGQKHDNTVNERREDLFRLPLVFLPMITDYLSAQDVFILWLTGDMSLRRVLADYGGLKSLKMDLYLVSSVRAPFRFIGFFSQLQSLHIFQHYKRASFYRSVGGDTDLTCLPRTLTSLNLTLPNVLSFFYNIQELALTLSTDYKSHTKGEETVPPFIITEYKRAGPDFSKIFYNLDELFPNLVNLEMASCATYPEGTLPADSIPYYDTRVAQHLTRSYLPKLTYPRHIWDESSQKSFSLLDDLSVDDAFVQSLPHGLRSLRLDFKWTWHYHSLANLPSTLADLTVHKISTISWDTGRLNEDTPFLSDNDEKIDRLNLTELRGSRAAKPTPKGKWHVSLSDAPLLPPSLTRLVVREQLSEKCIDALTERLPAGLQALKVDSAYILLKTESLEALPSDLQSLKVDFQQHFDICRIPAFLPRQLTTLSLCKTYVRQPEASNVKFIEWPLTLTQLEFGLPNDGCQNVLLESLGSLSQLSHLHINFSEYDFEASSGTNSIWPASMTFPATLRTLILSDAVLPDLHILPQGLTYFKVTRPCGGSSFQGMGLPTNELPPNLTRLELWGETPSRKSLPNVFSLVSPNLHILSLTLDKPNGRSIHFNQESLISPQISHLTHLRLHTLLAPPKSFTQCLPRTLTKLSYRGSRSVLPQIIDLPKTLQKLHITLLIPSNGFVHLPRHLISLRFGMMPQYHKKRSDKTEIPNEIPNEVINCIGQLPRSLTHLAMEIATNCTAAIIPYLPATLASHCTNKHRMVTFGQTVLYIPSLPNNKSCWFGDDE